MPTSWPTRFTLSLYTCFIELSDHLQKQNKIYSTNRHYININNTNTTTNNTTTKYGKFTRLWSHYGHTTTIGYKNGSYLLVLSDRQKKTSIVHYCVGFNFVFNVLLFLDGADESK